MPVLLLGLARLAYFTLHLGPKRTRRVPWLSAAAVSAFATRPLVAIGAAVFLLSDTLLALRRLLPGFSEFDSDFVIMLTYCLGQALIIAGVLVAARRSVSAREPKFANGPGSI